MRFFLPSCFVVKESYESDYVDYGKLQDYLFSLWISNKIRNDREMTELVVVDLLHGYLTQVMVV